MMSGFDGTALRVLREAAGLTVRDVAALAGVSTGHLSRVETGMRQPSSKWVHAVVSAIGKHLDDAA
jgi:predicted transcriptional regulator